MKFGVVVFPGSNCDYDAYKVLKDLLRQSVEYLWHKDTALKNSDCVILPGGFSYGDYLRTGAIARFSPIMREVRAFAARGGPVLGICNGFPILLAAGPAAGSSPAPRTPAARFATTGTRTARPPPSPASATRDGTSWA